jgi:hypothetical protein
VLIIAKVSINGLMDEVIKKNEIMSCAGKCIDLESIMFSEISQTQKDKYHVFSLICGI